VRPLAVLRPEPGASATVERARMLGLDAFALPLFAIEPLDWTVTDVTRFDALLLTSANAVRSAGERLRGLQSLPVHAVGPATAEAARNAGLNVADVGMGGIDELLSALPSDLRLLHLCGEDRRQPVLSGSQITPIPAYRSVAVPGPPGLERLTGAVVLVHSPRAGRRLAELAPSRQSTLIAAISTAAAEGCGAGWGRIAVAEHPRDDALLSLGARLCEQSQPK
jgi:uroporphyrinogen-III synthase